MNKLLEMKLEINEEDWKPTAHGRFLSKILSKNNLVENKNVLELGSGTGNNTILLLRLGAKHIVATEIAEKYMNTTKHNVELNVENPSIEYRVADWLSTTGKFDIIICNPPFCKSGKQNRRYFIDSLILDSHKLLNENGNIVFVQSSMADLNKTKERLIENGFEVRILGQKLEPFREYYFADPSFMTEIQTVKEGFDIINGTYYETLSVISAKLKKFPSPNLKLL